MDLMNLSKEIEKHDIILIDKIKEGQYEDMPINPLTLRAYLKDYEDIRGFNKYF